MVRQALSKGLCVEITNATHDKYGQQGVLTGERTPYGSWEVHFDDGSFGMRKPSNFKVVGDSGIKTPKHKVGDEVIAVGFPGRRLTVLSLRYEKDDQQYLYVVSDGVGAKKFRWERNLFTPEEVKGMKKEVNKDRWVVFLPSAPKRGPTYVYYSEEEAKEGARKFAVEQGKEALLCKVVGSCEVTVKADW